MLTSPDFLLFIPTQAPSLHAVLSYYQSAAQITPEGDVHISDEALQGLGTTLDFLKTSAFGAITSLVRPSNPSHKQLPPAQAASQAVADASQAAQLASAGFHDVEDEEVRVEDDPYIAIKPARRKLKLTDLVPDVGYFIAGGVSGITSRTVTAPLDRLKVYLIAQTTNSNDALQAAKSGAPIKAGRQGMRTLVNACKDLWAAGGIRSLFAGEYFLLLSCVSDIDNNHRQRYQRRQSHAGICGQVRLLRGSSAHSLKFTNVTHHLHFTGFKTRSCEVRRSQRYEEHLSTFTIHRRWYGRHDEPSRRLSPGHTQIPHAMRDRRRRRARQQAHLAHSTKNVGAQRNRFLLPRTTYGPDGHVPVRCCRPVHVRDAEEEDDREERQKAGRQGG